ncbi:MAG: hypothetical protein [Cressdnaviricota sp.]|nr:MAG: hypothetical protein [Cressdnaviricota sp.]
MWFTQRITYTSTYNTVLLYSIHVYYTTDVAVTALCVAERSGARKSGRRRTQCHDLWTTYSGDPLSPGAKRRVRSGVHSLER